MGYHVVYTEIDAFGNELIQYLDNIKVGIKNINSAIIRLASTQSVTGNVANRMKTYMGSEQVGILAILQNDVVFFIGAWEAYKARYTGIDPSYDVIIDTDSLVMLKGYLDKVALSAEQLSVSFRDVLSQVADISAVSSAPIENGLLAVYNGAQHGKQEIDQLVSEVENAEEFGRSVFENRLSAFSSVKSQITALKGTPQIYNGSNGTCVATNPQVMDNLQMIYEKGREAYGQIDWGVVQHQMDVDATRREVAEKVKEGQAYIERQKRISEAVIAKANYDYRADVFSGFVAGIAAIPALAVEAVLGMSGSDAIQTLESFSEGSRSIFDSFIGDRIKKDIDLEYDIYIETGERGGARVQTINDIKRTVLDVLLFSADSVSDVASILFPGAGDAVKVTTHTVTKGMHDLGYSLLEDSDLSNNTTVDYRKARVKGAFGSAKGFVSSGISVATGMLAKEYGNVGWLSKLTKSDDALKKLGGGLIVDYTSQFPLSVINNYANKKIDACAEGYLSSDQETWHERMKDGLYRARSEDVYTSDDLRKALFTGSAGIILKSSFDATFESTDIFQNMHDKGGASRVISSMMKSAVDSYGGQVIDEVYEVSFMPGHEDESIQDKLNQVFEIKPKLDGMVKASIQEIPNETAKMDKEVMDHRREEDEKKQWAEKIHEAIAGVYAEDMKRQDAENGRRFAEVEQSEVERALRHRIDAQKVADAQILDRHTWHTFGYQNHRGDVVGDTQQIIDAAIDNYLVESTPERHMEVRELVEALSDPDDTLTPEADELASSFSNHPMENVHSYQEVQQETQPQWDSADPDLVELSGKDDQGRPQVYVRYADVHTQSGYSAMNGRYFADVGATVDDVALKGKLEDIEAIYFRIADGHTATVHQGVAAPVPGMLPVSEKLPISADVHVFGGYVTGANRPGGAIQYISTGNNGIIDDIVEGLKIYTDENGNDAVLPQHYVDDYRSRHDGQLPESFLERYPQYR